MLPDDTEISRYLECYGNRAERQEAEFVTENPGHITVVAGAKAGCLPPTKDSKGK